MAEPRYKKADGGGSPRSSTSSILENLTIADKDEEAKLYDEDPERTGVDDARWRRSKYTTQVFRKHKLRFALGFLVTIVLLVAVGSFSGSAGHSDISGELLNFEEMRSGQYSPEIKQIAWIEGSPGTAESGAYLVKDGNRYYITSWSDKNNKTTILRDSLISHDGKSYMVQDLVLNKAHNKALLSTNHIKNWRHSYFAQYWILDIHTKKIEPLVSDDSDVKLALAVWSPRGDRVAYVRDRNLYLRYVGGDNNGESKQITDDGGDNVFNGIPDWVYEEEVLQDRQALWWSTDGDYLAFLHTDEQSVKEFTIPYFVQSKVEKDAYPEIRKIKYPKPGYDNPHVQLMLLDVSSEEHSTVSTEEHAPVDDIITEVVWLGNSKVFVRLTNRESDVSKISIVDAKEKKGSVVRKDDTKGKGWFEVLRNTHFIPADEGNGRKDDGYVDTIIVDGYNHLAYFSPVDSSEPKQYLTKGEWEVVDAPSSIDKENNIVYFIGTKKSPIERHLYSVQLDGTNFTEITDTSQDGHYKASFSSDSKFCLLSYMGPNVPWQMVIDMSSSSKMDGDMLTQNTKLEDRLQKYSLPILNYEQIMVDKDEDGKAILANAVEILPPSFDRHRKYPVLFHCYGGPISQTVKKTFGVDFQKILPSQEDIIVVIVDGRGTGFMGRDFRAVVRDKLGKYEAQDQIAAAKNWASRPYVDSSRLGIWGWSFGGYLTLKTLETDAGSTFSYGMAVAPVTDWRLYDSIYTERYMHTPARNRQGYIDSAITNATSLGQNSRFLVMHGTGDDNVHFQNTLVLLDKLDEASVENYDVHIFPDSDHSIYYHNANSIVYDKLYNWITNAFKGSFKDFN